MRLTRGFGTSAASLAMKSNGSKMTWVAGVPVAKEGELVNYLFFASTLKLSKDISEKVPHCLNKLAET